MFPEALRYTKDHEWVRADGSEYIVGITSYAAEQLGDVTYVELPKPGTRVNQHAEAGAVESVKAASDVYAPVSGLVSEVNERLEDKPELVNESPFEDGWFFKLTEVDASEIQSLMDAREYAQFVKDHNQ